MDRQEIIICSHSFVPKMQTMTTFQPYQKIVYNIKIGKSFFFGQDVLYIAISNTSQENAIMYLKEINDYKTNVLASISHELRTPLNGTMGLVQTLLNLNTIG